MSPFGRRRSESAGRAPRLRLPTTQSSSKDLGETFHVQGVSHGLKSILEPDFRPQTLSAGIYIITPSEPRLSLQFDVNFSALVFNPPLFVSFPKTADRKPY